MVTVTRYPSAASEEGSGVAWNWESAIYSSGTAQAQNISGCVILILLNPFSSFVSDSST